MKRSGRKPGAGKILRRAVVESLEGRLLLSAQLLKDINTLKSSQVITPGGLTAAGSVGYFSDSDGVHGAEVWKTDGTAAGTSMVADVNPGPAGSYPGGFVLMNGIEYFSATDGNDSNQLWRTDGTAAGTYLVKDFTPGLNGSYPTDFCPDNGTLYFFASDGVHGRELWKTDGTTAGTVMVDDTDPGSGGEPSLSGNSPRIAVLPGGEILFEGYTGSAFGLYTTTGAVGNETLVKSTNNVYDETGLVVAGSYAYWVDITGTLYQTNGTTAGTVSVATSAGRPVAAGSYVYYIQSSQIRVAGGNGLLLPVSGSLTSPAIVGTTATGIYFTGKDPSTQTTELWFSNGSAAGLVDPIGATTGVAVNGAFDFISGSSTAGYSLYSTNGTLSGTHLIATVNPGGSLSAPTQLTAVGTKLVFVNSDTTNGTQVWVSDGTTAGTGLLKAIFPGDAASVPTFWTQQAGGHLLFTANDGVTGQQLWSSDGTTPGTVELNDAYASSSGSTPNVPIQYGNDVVFRQTDPTDGAALWITDGTAPGTRVFAQASPPSTSYFPTPLAVLGGVVIYTATDSTHGTELWRSDGTTAGTFLLDDIDPGTGSSNPAGGFILNGVAYFSANDGTHGTELWRTDGTTAGTALVADLDPGSNSSSPGNFVPFNNGMIFFAKPASGYGVNIYRSDGTATGTVLITSLITSYSGVTVRGTAVLNGKVYFSADTSSTTDGLFATDGTAAGTAMVANDSSGALTVMNGRLYFVGSDGVHAGRLFSSQGTPATTGPVNATEPIAIAGNLSVVDGRLWFAAEDGSINGNELWTSDGTAAGTALYENFFPGPLPGVGASPVVGLAGNVFLDATDGVYSFEPWELTDTFAPYVTAASTTVAGSVGTHTVSFSFSQNVSSALSAASLQLTDLTTGQPVMASSTGYSYDTTANTATFALPTAALTDGLYQASLPAADIVDPFGVSAASAATQQFLAVAGLSANDSITISPSSDGSSVVVTKNGVQTFATPLSSLGSVVIVGGPANDSLVITLGAILPPGGYSFDGGAGTNTVTVVGTAGTHTVTITPAGFLYDSVPIGLANTSAPIFNPGGGIDALTLTTRAALPAGTATATVFSSLNIQPGGTLDLNGTDLDLPGASLAAVTAWVAGGYNLVGGASWTGTGITSTAAAADPARLQSIGVVQNNQGGAAMFSGTTKFDGLTPGTGDVLVKSTFVGDANLDGKVDGSDYSRLDAGYASARALTGWYNGDFNDDGVIDGSDYALIDNAFANQNRPAVPFAALNGSVLTVDLTQAGGPVTLSASGGVYIVSGTITSDFSQSSVSAVRFSGQSAGYSVIVNNDIAAPLTFAWGTGSNSLTLNPGAASVVTADPGATTSVTDAGNLTFGAGPAGGGINDVHLASLAVASNASVILSNAAASADRTLLIAGLLTIAAGGNLDMGDNDMDVTGTSAGGIVPEVAAGCAFGAWNGAGIDSSTAAGDTSHLTALGVLVNDQSGTPLFSAGHPFDGIVPNPGDTLVKFTYVGDANLDGKVDGSDYALLDAGSASKGKLTGWLNGDFNYDSAVDGSDYALIDNAFNNQGTPIGK